MDLPLRPAQALGTSSLHSVGMLDLLDQDTRPTFILDTASTDVKLENGSLLEYWNGVMADAGSGVLLQQLSSNASVPSSKEKGYAPFSQFRSWSLARDTENKSFLYHGFTWTKVMVAQWNVISGIPHVPSVSSEKLEALCLPQKRSKPKVPNYDWTDELPPLQLTPHAAWARSIDW
jgi:hypothetical protein